MDDQDLRAALSHAARTIGQARTSQETLQTIAETALLSIPSIEHVGVSVLDRKGNAVTKAATSDLVLELDELQYSLHEGPCVDSLRGATVVAAPRIRDDSRWPRYVPPAVRLGLKAQLAVRLYLDEQGTVGGLNMYSTGSEDIDPQAPGIADLFAAHAALALDRALKVDHLNEALQTREVIGEAVGLLMAKYDWTRTPRSDFSCEPLRTQTSKCATSRREWSRNTSLRYTAPIRLSRHLCPGQVGAGPLGTSWLSARQVMGPSLALKCRAGSAKQQEERPGSGHGGRGGGQPRPHAVAHQHSRAEDSRHALDRQVSYGDGVPEEHDPHQQPELQQGDRYGGSCLHPALL